MEKNGVLMNSFNIRGFKKFKSITFDNLSRVNLFLGNNNSGKTTTLEAIYAFCCGASIYEVINICAIRSKREPGKYEFMETLPNMFYEQDSIPLTFSLKASYGSKDYEFVHQFVPYMVYAELKPHLMRSFGDKSYENKGDQIEEENIGSVIEKGKLGEWSYEGCYENFQYDAIGFNIRYPFDIRRSFPRFALSRFVDILTHRDQSENTRIYGFLKRERLLDELISEIAKTFPEIESIDLIPYPDGTTPPVSVITKDKEILPLYSFGDGMQRWYNILGGMIVYQNAVHCIEEIDATLHPNAQKDLARNLVYYSEKYNNQIFMTSHSLEFVDNLLESVYGPDSDNQTDNIRIITLKDQPETGETRVRVLTGREAYESREKYKMELR